MFGKDYIIRSIYLDKIKPFIGKELIKVIIGQRRTGKSYLLYQIMDEIRKDDQNANIIYINRELYEFSSINNHEELYGFIKADADKSSLNYVFIDEVQTIFHFEHAIKSLLAEGNFDIYITGSNADLLSTELATLLGGRYIEITVHPLGFSEFLDFHKLKPEQSSLHKYMQFGGMPYLKNLPLKEDIVYEYLRNIYQSILYRDIVSRFEIRNVMFLNDLITYLAANTGTLFSARNITNYLKSQKSSVSTPAIIAYLDFLNKAFFTIKIKRSDIQGKKIFEVGEKHYFNDLGIRNTIVGFRPDDLGLIIENIVFNHLRSKDFKLFTGKSGDREIDFVAEKRGEKIYFQVCLSLIEPQTLEREFGNLMAISDQYPKYVISLEKTPAPNSYNGIRSLSLLEFLTEF